MKRLAINTAIAGILAAGSLSSAGPAAAAPLGGTSADQTIAQLKADGYDVQLNLNGARDVPLSECTVSGVHGIPNTAPLGGAPTTQFTTVYVDVACPADN
jgi:hypothetical protein